MYLLLLGIVFLTMKYMEIAPVAGWDWWVVLAPFGLAVAWWAWADASGYTKRKAMELEAKKVKARVDANKEAIGTLRKKGTR